MHPHKDWHLTYKPLDSGVVLMGNNAQCSIAGIDTVQIKTYGGVLRTLSNVRHIPDLKYNLISSGTLESNRCKYSAEGGVLKISKGVLVLIKGVRRGSLYIIRGSTVIGSAAVTTPSSEVDSTQLQHARLDHMSGKGMTILNKRGLLVREGTGKLDFCDHCVFKKQKKVFLLLLTVLKIPLIIYILTCGVHIEFLLWEENVIC